MSDYNLNSYRDIIDHYQNKGDYDSDTDMDVDTIRRIVDEMRRRQDRSRGKERRSDLMSKGSAWKNMSATDRRFRSNYLQGNKRWPSAVEDVYVGNYRLESMLDLVTVRKTTRDVVFPRSKFITSVSRRSKFDEPKKIEPKTIPFVILQKLGWLRNMENEVNKAVLWNTYSREVERTLRQCQSTCVSSMKKHFMKGNFCILSCCRFVCVCVLC